jgi:DNA-binding response OmpR family regulator
MVSPSFKDLAMSTKLILLIESESSLREVLRACLQEFAGWEILVSQSIQEGIQLCEDSHPDVILLDTSTPESDALLFLEQLKTCSRKKSIPILLISERASWFSVHELNRIGFAGAIDKPFNPSTLSARVAHLLGWNEENS